MLRSAAGSADAGLVQRHGRIDRIGSKHREVFLRCVFPDTRLDELLGLEERLNRKIAQAAASVGVGEVIPDQQRRLDRSFSETREEIERLRAEDASIFERGGTRLGAQSGEECGAAGGRGAGLASAAGAGALARDHLRRRPLGLLAGCRRCQPATQMRRPWLFQPAVRLRAGRSACASAAAPGRTAP